MKRGLVLVGFLIFCLSMFSFPLGLNATHHKPKDGGVGLAEEAPAKKEMEEKEDVKATDVGFTKEAPAAKKAMKEQKAKKAKKAEKEEITPTKEKETDTKGK